MHGMALQMSCNAADVRIITAAVNQNSEPGRLDTDTDTERRRQSHTPLLSLRLHPLMLLLLLHRPQTQGNTQVGMHHVF